MHINNTHICLNKHMKWKGDNLYNEQYNDRSNIMQQVKARYIYIKCEIFDDDFLLPFVWIIEVLNI
jgi:hypothetical protein